MWEHIFHHKIVHLLPNFNTTTHVWSQLCIKRMTPFESTSWEQKHTIRKHKTLSDTSLVTRIREFNKQFWASTQLTLISSTSINSHIQYTKISKRINGNQKRAFLKSKSMMENRFGSNSQSILKRLQSHFLADQKWSEHMKWEDIGEGPKSYLKQGNLMEWYDQITGVIIILKTIL